MRSFWLGFVIGIIALGLAAFFYVRSGLIDPRADVPASGLEEKLAMPALDAAVARHAPGVKNPVDASGENLLAGMKIYQTNCASCHGDIHRLHGIFADAFSPRAPQFLEEAPEMPENQNFYIIQHGIRLSGMPAWKNLLSEQEMWQVTTFLTHMNGLPPDIAGQWKALASGNSKLP